MERYRLRWLRRNWWVVLLLVWLSVVLSGCSGGDDTPTLTVVLEASPAVITLGESAELRWQIDGTAPFELSLTPPVTGELVNPLTVSPDVTTTYTLTVNDTTGSSSASTTVTVISDDVGIDAFTAEVSGLGVTFAWTLTGNTQVACTLNPGDGSEVLELPNCTSPTTYRYNQAGNYDAQLTLANGVSATVNVTVTGGDTDVGVSGFVDEQSRNVVIILTDEGEQAVSVDSLNRNIARVEASYGQTVSTNAIRGLNAAVLGLLQNTPTSASGTPNLLDLGSEFVVAVDAAGNVLATSPLTREAEARLGFNLALPTEQDVALLLAEPDGLGGWVCKGSLEYQRVQNQRTVASEQVIYRFDNTVAGRDDLQAGAFTFNELTANLAARNDTSGDTSGDVLPSDEVQAATISLADAPDFQDGLYRFCENDNLAREDVLADLDWRSDIFNVATLPPETSPDLVNGETAVYDLALALLLEPQPDGSNRLVATSPLGENGNLRAEVVRSAADNLDATLFFTDVAFFDADKRRFPLTPTYQFDAQARTPQSPQTQALMPNVPDSNTIDLGVIDGGLGYISGRVRTADGTPVPDANVIIVLDGERVAFNVAVSDDNGFYELLIPSDTTNSYILYGQNAPGTLAGIASNDNTGVRYEVGSSDIFDQDIILDVPISPDPTPSANPPIVNAGADQVSNGGTVLLTGTASDPDGDTLSVRWQVLTRPEGSNPRLGNPNALVTRFDADTPGVYQLRLRAFDGALYAADVLTVTVRNVTSNTPPVVEAGENTVTTPNTAIVLAGSAFDLDDDALTLTWQVTSGPEGSNTQLSNPNAATTTFTADTAGSYQVQFSASDGALSASDFLTIQVEPNVTPVNNPPIVNAGMDVEVDIGAVVTLEGSATDPDEDPLTFTWQVVDSPVDSNPVFSDPNAATTTFTADTAGSYQVQFSASDGALSASDFLTVQVTDTTPVNDPPQVSAGEDTSVKVGSSITLTGVAEDPENDPLTVTWDVISRPADSEPLLSTTTTAITTFTSNIAGEYILRFTADDGINPSVSDELTVTVTAIIPTWSVTQDTPLDTALGTDLPYNFSQAIRSSADYQSASAERVAEDNTTDLVLKGDDLAGVIKAVSMVWSEDSVANHFIDVVFDTPQGEGNACAYSVAIAPIETINSNINTNDNLLRGELTLQGEVFEVALFGDSNANGICELDDIDDIEDTAIDRLTPDTGSINFTVTFSNATDNTDN